MWTWIPNTTSYLWGKDLNEILSSLFEHEYTSISLQLKVLDRRFHILLQIWKLLIPYIVHFKATLQRLPLNIKLCSIFGSRCWRYRKSAIQIVEAVVRYMQLVRCFSFLKVVICWLAGDKIGTTQKANSLNTLSSRSSLNCKKIYPIKSCLAGYASENLKSFLEMF